jgi:hypothetical protein
MRLRPGYSEEVSHDGLVASRGPSDRANLMHIRVSRRKETAMYDSRGRPTVPVRLLVVWCA